MPGFRQLEAAVDHGLPPDKRHAGRQRFGGSGGDRECLPKHPLRGGHERRRQRIGAGWQHDRVWRERHTTLADAGEQANAAIGFTGERARCHLAGLLRQQPEPCGHGLARRNGLERHAWVRDQLCTRDAQRIEVDADQVGDRSRGVGHRGIDVVWLPAAHRARMRQRHRKGRVAHEHGTGSLADKVDGARRQPIEHGLDGNVEDVAALLQPFKQELAVATSLRRNAVDVVGGAELAVGPDLNHAHGGQLTLTLDPREPERIVARVLVRRARDTVQAGRQLRRSPDIAQDERCAIRRHVGHHQHDREELVQERHVARDHDQPGDRRDVEAGILAVFDHREERHCRDREVEARPIELGGQRGLQSRQLLVDDAQLPDEQRAIGLGVDQLTRGQRHRHLDRERLAIDIEGHLEVDRLEVVLVDDDPFFPDLIERQRPRRHVGDKDFVDHTDGNGGGGPAVSRRGVEQRHAVLDQAKPVEEVVARQGERGQRQRLARTRGDPRRGDRRSA